jgi:hypothetical protein
LDWDATVSWPNKIITLAVKPKRFLGG